MEASRRAARAHCDAQTPHVWLPAPDDVAHDRETAARRKALVMRTGRYTEADYFAFLQVVEDGFTLAEAAKNHGSSKATVGRRIQSIQAFLRHLKEIGEESPPR